MYPNLGPGQTLELAESSGTSSELVYPHEYVAERMNLYLYARANPLTFVDPYGLQAQSFHNIWLNTAVRGHPWENEQNIIGIGGTRFWWTIKCVCRRYEEERTLGGFECGFCIDCDVKIYSQISLDLRSHREQGIPIAGTYGHEQMHVQSFFASATRYIQGLSSCFYLPSRRCPPAKVRALETLINTGLESIQAAEEQHGNPGSPLPNRPYPPIGPMPRRPIRPRN